MWGLCALQDGWKVDGTDPFIIEYIVPHGYDGGVITYRDYADAYYRKCICLGDGFVRSVPSTRRFSGDFFNYTRSRNGPHCLIWSRPVDSYQIDDIAGLFAFASTFPVAVRLSGSPLCLVPCTVCRCLLEHQPPGCGVQWLGG